MTYTVVVDQQNQSRFYGAKNRLNSDNQIWVGTLESLAATWLAGFQRKGRVDAEIMND